MRRRLYKTNPENVFNERLTIYPIGIFQNFRGQIIVDLSVVSEEVEIEEMIFCGLVEDVLFIWFSF